MLFSLKLLFIIFKTTGSIIYNGQYFDVKDRTRAECVLGSYLFDYQYLGDKSVTINGEKCESWIIVFSSWFPDSNLDQKKAAKIQEKFPHSKCRNFELSELHPFFSYGEQAATKKLGPWCFVRFDNKYKPVHCFSKCNETKIEVPHNRKKASESGYVSLKLNYNVDLLNPIDKLFKNYDFGNQRYYGYKPSKEHPPEFYQLRREIFIALCIVFIVVLSWILICFFLKKRAARIHREREKNLQRFCESTSIADVRMRIELDRE